MQESDTHQIQNDLRYDFPQQKSKKLNKRNTKRIQMRRMMAEKETDLYEEENDLDFDTFIQKDEHYFDSEQIRPHSLGPSDTYTDLSLTFINRSRNLISYTYDRKEVNKITDQHN